MKPILIFIMKKFTLTILLTLSLGFTFAQDLETLKTEAQKSYVAGANLDFEGIFETTYPKVFDIVSKDMLKASFDQMFNNDDFKIELVEVEPNFSFGEIQKIGEQTFCLIDHDTKMIMTFKEKMEEVEMMTDLFKSSMQAEEVTFNEEENAFHIKVRSTLIGISDEITNHTWKFMNKDKNNQLSKMIFSDEVITKLEL